MLAIPLTQDGHFAQMSIVKKNLLCSSQHRKLFLRIN
jgi:hypothetical protein